jgi:hypothetical protein
VAPADGTITVNSCGTTDTRVSVLSGACASLSCVATNDDANQAFACQTGDFAAGLTTAVTGGVTYYIQWDNRWSSASAAWNLSFTSGPVTTPCDDAIAIADCGTAVSTAFSPGPGGFSGFLDCTLNFFALNGDEQVYTYVPSETGLYTVQANSVTIPSGFFMNFLVQEGSCTSVQGDYTCLLDVSGPATSAPFTMTAGETYYFLVKSESTAGSSTNWTINCALPPIANDACADAEAISCGGSATGTTVGATADNAGFCGTSNDTAGVWYVLSDAAAGDEVTASLCTGTSYDSKISIYSGSCAGLTCVTGNDDACAAQSEATWTADGSVYYILVHGFSGSTGAFTLNVTCEPPAPIAWCASATTIGCDASASGTTVGAATENIPGSTCGTTGNTSPKLAFIFTGIGEDVQANTFGSVFDTKLWVYEYSGGCQAGDLVCVGGNDDFGGGVQSQVSFFGASGQDYLIVVGGFGAFDSGTYALNVLCGPFGCTDPAACNYDDTAANDDGSCFFICNDVPAGAVALAATQLGTCSPTSGNLQDATTGSGNVGSGVDLWYSFTAATSGVRVEVVGTAFDAVIELRNMDESPLGVGSTEDVTFTNGTEILNFAGLTPGTDYLVRVGAWSSFGSGSRPFDVCIQFLPDTQCDYPVGVTSTTRSLCQNAKAAWVSGGSNYTFHFTPVGGGATITYETGAAFTIAPLQNVPGLVWGTTYEVEIDVELSLANGAGTPEAITVLSSGACELVISDAPVAALRAADNVTNAGPLPLGAYIAATPWACTATEWEWVFTNTNGSQLPFTHLSGAPGRFVRLSDVSGLNAGDVYNVQVRPVFATAYVGAFGASDQIAIIGALGMVDDVTSPVANTEIDERVEATVIAAGVALYPNPNRGDFVNVNIANVAVGVERVIFDLYDLTGKRVISQQIAVAGSGVNVVMPLNGLADGMYIANIIVGDEVHTERIAVQK